MTDYREAVENAARAIKIKLGPGELEQFAHDLSAFERWLEPLLKVDTAFVEPLLYSHTSVNIFREDKAETGDLKPLQQAAVNFLEGFYRVPIIIE